MLNQIRAYIIKDGDKKLVRAVPGDPTNQMMVGELVQDILAVCQKKGVQQGWEVAEEQRTADGVIFYCALWRVPEAR